MAIDNPALARTMTRLAVWMDSRCRPEGLIQHTFDAAPYGTAYVCISRSEESPFASANQNRIHLCGTEGGLTAQGLADLCKLFDDAGVGRFFVWLSPGPDMDAVRGWLGAAGFARNPHVAHPMLARNAGKAAPVVTDLDIRELSIEEAARLAGRLDGVAWPDFQRSAGTAGMNHFIAYDRDRPVGSAVLCAFEEVGYLCMAFTGEPDRRRGAQQALIASRMEKATALGCRILVSETLSFLKSSLGNLRKAGFEPVYEREVYNSNPD